MKPALKMFAVLPSITIPKSQDLSCEYNTFHENDALFPGADATMDGK